MLVGIVAVYQAYFNSTGQHTLNILELQKGVELGAYSSTFQFWVFATFFIAFAGGLADVTALGRSQVSTALPVDLTRATVAASLGLGAGMVIVALLKLPRSGAT